MLWFKTWIRAMALGVQALWYSQSRLSWLLWPVSLMLQSISWVRRKALEATRQALDVPVIVVGNITVGGVGKTPLVIALAQYFCTKGLRVGIVSRGYGATIRAFPHEVLETDDAKNVGDEPKLISLKTACPVVIAPKRIQAVKYLLEKYQSQIIISDDGLQHYALPRTVEIVVIDGMRGFGNGFCLPAGPLRESPKRLRQVDFIVINGTMSADESFGKMNSDQMIYKMDIVSNLPHAIPANNPVAWTTLKTPLSAVAAIGHPERFFALFDTLGLAYQPYVFPDHHAFSTEELERLPKPIVMTEKDAVKCYAFGIESMYCVPVEAKLNEEFWTALWLQIT